MKKTIEEVIEIKTKHEEALFSVNGVFRVDVGIKDIDDDPDEVFIRVFMKDLSNKHLVPKELDGVETHVIEGGMPRALTIGASDNEVLTTDNSAGTVNPKSRYDPLEGGISVGPCRSIQNNSYVGTLGALVIDNSDGQVYGLSNFHVLCVDSNWKPGDQVVQPSRPDGGSCPSDVVGEIVKGAFPGQGSYTGSSVDAAVTSILQRDVSHKCLGLGDFAKVTSPTIGTKVKKMGRTTDLTYGTITGIKGTVVGNFGSLGKAVTLHNQITIDPSTKKNQQFCKGGDSGSVVVDDNMGVIGLLCAEDSKTGSGIANNFSDVEAALNVKLFTKWLTQGMGYLGATQFNYNIASSDNSLQHVAGTPATGNQIELINHDAKGYSSFRNQNGLYLNANLNFTAEGADTKWQMTNLGGGQCVLENLANGQMLQNADTFQVGFSGFPPSAGTSNIFTWTKV